MSLSELFSILKGAAGSGNWGHAGRAGTRERGGSVSRNTAMSIRTGRDWQQRQLIKKTPKKGFDPALHGDDVLVEQTYSQGLSIDDSFNNYVGVIQCSTKVRGEIKDEIINTLSSKTGLSYEAVNEAIQQWADTSNDTVMKSLSLQESAARVFDIELLDWQKNKITFAKNKSGDSYKKEVMFQNNHKPYKSPKAAQDAFIKAMYEHTQNEFRKAGIKNVTLYRGSNKDLGRLKGDIIKIKGNALESWTASESIANSFGNNRLSTTVPVERILGNSRTGYGCLNEYEFVVIGGNNDYAQVD